MPKTKAHFMNEEVPVTSAGSLRGFRLVTTWKTPQREGKTREGGKQTRQTHQPPRVSSMSAGGRGRSSDRASVFCCVTFYFMFLLQNKKQPLFP